MMLACQKIFGDSLTKQENNTPAEESVHPTSKCGMRGWIGGLRNKVADGKDIVTTVKQLLELCMHHKEDCKAVVKLHYLMKYFGEKEEL